MNRSLLAHISTTVRGYTIIIKTSLLVFLLNGCDKTKTYRIQHERVVIDSLDQIIPITDSLVRPVTYVNVSSLARLPVSTAKEKFIAVMLPAILIAKHEIETVRIKTQEIINKKKWSRHDSLFYLSVKEKHKASDSSDLMLRLQTVPVSIALAQAAVESGWGQSRFFTEANNVFGIWSYRRDEPRIAAREQREEKTIYLRKYDSILESVHDYFLRLSRARAYRHLRKAMSETDDPLLLLPHLKYYSERRNDYVNQLKSVILFNDFVQYDRYIIDPQYLIEEE